jgi:hypothetical protein
MRGDWKKSRAKVRIATVWPEINERIASMSQINWKKE